ncbi:hypothetical protein HS088_TW23G00172 [Tripterygium wilfordii]|uniref:QLQ domain-containing protein n=1 Tax=Tripterygium wilfordii TaxID=458696 RepID=A0A7J7BU06_TRIWF|nr:hypothetical protein HS088_TW23G00172 [Tripterygium wilfordii]
MSSDLSATVAPPRLFAVVQWQELERQAFIFKYLKAGVPVPYDLRTSIILPSFLSQQNAVALGAFNPLLSNNFQALCFGSNLPQLQMEPTPYEIYAKECSFLYGLQPEEEMSNGEAMAGLGYRDDKKFTESTWNLVTSPIPSPSLGEPRSDAFPQNDHTQLQMLQDIEPLTTSAAMSKQQHQHCLFGRDFSSVSSTKQVLQSLEPYLDSWPINRDFVSHVDDSITTKLSISTPMYGCQSNMRSGPPSRVFVQSKSRGGPEAKGKFWMSKAQGVAGDLSSQRRRKDMVAIPESVQRLWDAWNIRGVILVKHFSDHVTDAIFQILHIDKALFTKAVSDFFHKVIKSLTYLPFIGGVVRFIKTIIHLVGRGIKAVLDFIIEFLGLTDLVDEILYKSSEPLTKELWDFIFHEVKNKSKFADDPETAKRISSAKVAGIGKIRFRDTCAEAERFFRRRNFGPNDETDACKSILEINTDVSPIAVKGDRSKSVLFDASILAKELQKLKQEKWKLMSRVWVEILSYAAGHCVAKTHAEQVSRGGELITFVWLLMAHFGIGEQFQINEGHARAKLMVGK